MRCHVSIVIAALMLATAARAQIPSLGFCPEYLPMPGFEMERFAGSWYEAERYFQLSEVASRCVMSNYTKGPDGKYHVSNEVTSRFTGIKRVLEGEIRKPNSKAEEGKLHVKYTTVPLIPLETQYNVLETDYKNYAVLWSCSGVGPVHTQNAWIMTRQRVAPGEILQKAYGVLDKYKISKVFFVKTNQDDCAYLDSLQAEAAKPTEPPKVADTEEEEDNQSQALRSAVPVRQHIVPDAPEAVIQTRNAEIKAAAEAVAAAAEATAAAAAAAAIKPIAAVRQPEPIAVEPVKAAPEPTTKIPARFEQLPKLAAKEPLANEPAKEQTREEAIAVPAELPIEPVLADEPSKTESKLVLEGKVEVVKP